jgi:galactonate dehydratase
MEDMYMVSPQDAGRFADLAKAVVEDGYTAFKCMGVPETANIEGLKPIRYAESCLRAMRDAVGPDIDIMIDAHARQSPRMAIQFAKALEPYGLYWYEEPCWPENMDGIAEVQRAVSTPIATGERLITQHAFRELLEKRAASILQPDITHCGGLSEARKIAAMAEAYRVALAPHNPQGPVSTAASIEFGFATPSYLICEAVHNDVPWRDDVVEWGFTTQEKGRLVFPNERPGLGIEVNEKEIAKHPFQAEVLQRSFLKDGSVTDW